MFSLFQITTLVLHRVCLKLKTDVSVSLTAVAVLDKAESPLQDIPHIEENVNHFTHLGCVYLLMPHVSTTHYTILSDK